MSFNSPPPFSKNTRNKIGNEINVSGTNTLVKTTESNWQVAIADEPINAAIDGHQGFCVRVDNFGTIPCMMFGFTTVEKFDSNKSAFFGTDAFNGCGIATHSGQLNYPGSNNHNIINKDLSKSAEEIICVLTISNNGKKKEIRFFAMEMNQILSMLLNI
jgi:hypothetical protein